MWYGHLPEQGVERHYRGLSDETKASLETILDLESSPDGAELPSWEEIIAEESEEAKLKEEQDRIEKAEEQRTALENAASAAVESLQPKASPSPDPEQDGDDREVRTAGSVGSKYVSALVSGGDPKSCKAIGGALADNTWCETSCSNNPPNCPSTICKCGDAPAGAPALINAEASPSPVPAPRKMTKEEKDTFVLIAVMVVASVVLTMAITIHTLYVDHTRISQALREPLASSAATGSTPPRRRSPRLAASSTTTTYGPTCTPWTARRCWWSRPR